MRTCTQLKPKGSTRVKPQQVVFELKHRVLLALNKLTDRDTHQIGVDELEKIAESLTPEGISSFLSCVLDTDSEQKSAVRKECIRMMGVLATQHEGLICSHLGKMVTSIVKRLKDSDSVVRDACVETSGVLASKLGNQPSKSNGNFATLVKPFFEALGEQNRHVQSGAALCLSRVIDNMNDPPVSVLQQMMTRTIKLLKSPHFMAKPAIIELHRSLIQAGGAPSQRAFSAAVGSIQEALKSSDWTTRRAASLALEEIGSSGGSFLVHFKASCIHSLESCRFDKVKPVRDAVLQALHFWKTIPDPEIPEPSETGSCTKENLCSDLASVGGSVWEDAVHREPSVGLAKKRSPLSGQKAGQNYAEKLNKSKVSNWCAEAAVSKAKNHISKDIHHEESEGSSATKTLETVTADAISIQQTGCDYALIYDKQNCSSASNHVLDNFCNRYGSVHGCFADRDSMMKPTGNRHRFSADGNCGEMQSYFSKMQDRTSLDSTVTDSEVPHTVHVCCAQTVNEITSIRKQLLEIEKRQSSLMDLLQGFTTSTMESLSVIQSKVSGLERAVDDVVHVVGHGERYDDLSCAKFVKKCQNIASPRISTCTPMSSVDLQDGESSVLPLRNSKFMKDRMLRSIRGSSYVGKVTDNGTVLESNTSRNFVWDGSDKSTRQGKQSLSWSQNRNDIIFASASVGCGKHKIPTCNTDLWKRVKDCLSGGDMDSAYREVLSSGDGLLLIKLLDTTGPVLESLSKKTVCDLLSTLASCLSEQRFINTIIPWLQQVADLSTTHGPNYIPLSFKAKQEILSAVKGTLNAAASHPSERRLVAQLAMNLQDIWGGSVEWDQRSWCSLPY
ncbi:hypothetical protein Ancab_022645 [Ancistrocladus abbreviatus]